MSNAPSLRCWARAVASLGVKQGTSTYLLPRLIDPAGRKVTRMRIPGLSHPVWLRPASTDWFVMEKVFIDLEYSLSRWPEHEAAITRLYQGILQRGRTPVIIDAGAHVGLTAIWFAQLFPDAHIFAVEPAPANFDILRRNASPYPSITPIDAGIWDHDTRIRLVNDYDEPWAWEAAEAAGGDVGTVTIESLLSRQPGGVPFIIKIDIEGGETALFRSNIEWVAQTPLIVFELHDWLGGWRGTGHAVFSRLCTHPRDYMQRGENMFAFAHSLLRRE